jgi:hypothetical protein
VRREYYRVGSMPCVVKSSFPVSAVLVEAGDFSGVQVAAVSLGMPTVSTRAFVRKIDVLVCSIEARLRSFLSLITKYHDNKSNKLITSKTRIVSATCRNFKWNMFSSHYLARGVWLGVAVKHLSHFSECIEVCTAPFVAEIAVIVWP